MTKQEKIILILIIVIGFVLHSLAINYALPLRFFGDEYIHLANSLKMLEQKTIFLNFSYLPSLFAYLLMPFILTYGLLGMIFGLFANLNDFQEAVVLHSEELLIFSRFLALVFSAAGVYLIFKFTKELFNTKAGLVSAGLLTILPLHLQESQAGRFWLPLSFFILAAAYTMLLIVKTGKASWYYWSAIFIGLGFGMGLVAIILIPWLIGAHYWSSKKKATPFFSKNFIISFIILLLIIGFFSATNTYSILRQFGRGLGTILDIFGLNISVPQSSPVFIENNFFTVLWQVAKVIWSNFYGLLLFLLIGLFLLGKRKGAWQNYDNFFLIVWPIGYLIGLAVVFNTTLDRYTLPALLFFIPLIAYSCLWLAERLKLKKVVLAAGLIFFSLPQLFFSYQYSEKILRTNTLSQTKNWLEQNIESGKKIVLDECPVLYLTPNQESLILQKDNNPFFFDTRSKLLLNLTATAYPQPNYFIYNFSHLDLEKLSPQHFQADYYVVCFWNSKADWSSYQQLLFNDYQLDLLTKFYPTREKYNNQQIEAVHNTTVGSLKTLTYLERLGPRVEIYQLIPTASYVRKN